MFFICISILLGFTFIFKLSISDNKSNKCSMDLSDFSVTFLVSMLASGLIFFLTVLPQAAIASGNKDCLDSENYEIVEMFSTLHITTTDNSFVFSDEQNSIIADKRYTFFIPSQDNEITLYCIKESNQPWSLIKTMKYFIYIPNKDYEEMVNSLKVDYKYRQLSTYLDSAEDIANNTEKVVGLSPNTIVESKKIFQYEIVKNNYIIRCEDSSVITVDTSLVTMKKS